MNKKTACLFTDSLLWNIFNHKEKNWREVAG